VKRLTQTRWSERDDRSERTICGYRCVVWKRTPFRVEVTRGRYCFVANDIRSLSTAKGIAWLAAHRLAPLPSLRPGAGVMMSPAFPWLRASEIGLVRSYRVENGRKLLMVGKTIDPYTTTREEIEEALGHGVFAIVPFEETGRAIPGGEFMISKDARGCVVTTRHAAAAVAAKKASGR